MASLLTTARFFTTVAKLAQLPREGTPEVAFVCRSNAGKSSAINALCQRRRLAFASKTPGRTQALNFFALGPESEAPRAFVVDTPGYGYASAPEEVKRSWDQLAGRYLAVRDALRGVVLVLDVRRQLTALDRQLLGFLRPETPLLVLLTKSDKLGTAQLREAMRGVERGLQEMGLPNAATLISFSSTERVGLDEVRELVDGWLADADAPAEGASSG